MLNKIIESSNIDAVFITDMYNLRYFTGFTGTTGIALATKEGNFFFSDFRYKEQGAKQVEANGFTFVEVGRNSLDKVKELIDKFGIKKLGFEDLNMTFSYYKKIEELFKVELVQLGSILSNQRLIKKDFEIENIKKATEISDIAFCLPNKELDAVDRLVYDEQLNAFRNQLSSEDATKLDRLLAGECFRGRKKMIRELKFWMVDFDPYNEED